MSVEQMVKKETLRREMKKRARGVARKGPYFAHGILGAFLGGRR